MSVPTSGQPMIWPAHRPVTTNWGFAYSFRVQLNDGTTVAWSPL